MGISDVKSANLLRRVIRLSQRIEHVGLILYLTVIVKGWSTLLSVNSTLLSVKSSVNRYGKGQRGIAGEHLYLHFLLDGHNGVEDMSLKIIDKTDISDPVKREAFWAYKLNSFVPSRD